MSLLTLCSVIQSIGQKNRSSITKAQKTDFLTGILFDRCIKNVLANTCHFHSELQRAPTGSHKRTSGASRSLFLFRAGRKKKQREVATATLTTSSCQQGLLSDLIQIVDEQNLCACVHKNARIKHLPLC